MGTTSVKVCILDLEKEVIACVSKPTIADMASDYAGPGSLQDVPKIIEILQECVEKLPTELLEKVRVFISSKLINSFKKVLFIRFCDRNR